MNILYLNHYAGSPALGMEYRPYYLAREWVRQGHRVQIVAADFSHVRAQQPPAGDSVVDGIAYRFRPTPRYQGNGPGRVWNIARFLGPLWAQAGRHAAAGVQGQPPDVVIASSTYPMDFWVARRIARRVAGAGAVLVHEVHDLWPLSPIELSGMSPAHPFIRLCQAAEDAACTQADLVVSMLPRVHQHMAAHGLDLRRLAIVPNGITLDEWQGTPPPLRADVAQAVAELRAQGLAVVGHAGSMGLPNALDTLLDAARLLVAPGAGAESGAPPLGLVLVGDGHERERLVARIAAEGLGARVRWLPPIPKAQVPAFLAAIDIAYIGWQRVPIYRFGIAPNKLMDYLMAGCPVLHSVAAGNDPVAECGAGLTVPPEDPAAVAAGLQQLAALPPAERRAMGARGRAFVQAEHTYPVLAARFIEAVQAARRLGRRDGRPWGAR